MRTRDRPWASAVTRRVSPPNEATYYREPALPQTHQLASRGEQPYQLLGPQSYSSCFHHTVQNGERNVYLTDCQRNKNHSVVSFEKTILQVARYQPLLTGRYSSEASGRRTSLLRQETISNKLSSSACDRPTRQVSSLSSRPAYLKTRSFLFQRSKSTSQFRLKVRPLTKDNSRSIEDINRSANSRALYSSLNVAGSVTENTQAITVDKVTNFGMKNIYRNINETLFDLSPDSETADVSGEVTFAIGNNGGKSPEFRQMSFKSASRTTGSPDLPPIACESPRGDKWRIASSSASSNTGIKMSADRRSTAVSRTTNYSSRNSTTTTECNTHGTVAFADDRLNKDRLPICRNHSDSSLYKLNTDGSYPSKESDSTSLSCGTLRFKEVGGSSSSSQGRDDVRNGGVKDAKHLGSGNRKPTLPAVDSQGRLETLFEGQTGRKNITYSINNSERNNNIKVIGKYSYNQVDSSNKVTRSRNVNKGIFQNSSRVSNNLNIINNMPSTSPLPRSVFINDIATNEATSRHRTPNRKSTMEVKCADTTDGVFKSKARITRSQSENKLNEISTGNKYQDKTTPRSISRNLSAERIDKIRPHSQKYRRAVTSSRNQQGGNFQTKYSSVSNVNNRYSREALNDTNIQDDRYYIGDSIETKDRLVAWLYVVNNIDRYDTDPKDDIIDYSDEPPQTDTAIHLVYEGD